MAGRDFQQTGNGLGLVVGGDSLVGSAIHASCRELRHCRRAVVTAPGNEGLLPRPAGSRFHPTRAHELWLCVPLRRGHRHAGLPGGSCASTRQVNVANTIELMRRLADRGTHLVFLSSSQVFDGETANPTEEAATMSQERIRGAETCRRAGDRALSTARRDTASDQDTRKSSRRRLQGVV